MSDCISGQRGLDVQDTIFNKAVGSIICVPVIARIHLNLKLLHVPYIALRTIRIPNYHLHKGHIMSDPFCDPT